jgi:hypothetical protein
MTDEKAKSVDENSRHRKLLSIVDKVAILIAVSLGISTIFVEDDVKAMLLLIAVIPAAYLVTRSVILLRELKANSKSAKPFESFYNCNLWIQLVVNSFAIVGNIAISMYLFFYR